MPQFAYRQWKQSFFPDLLYFTMKSQTLRSASSMLFTELYPYFYHDTGRKQIPYELFNRCIDPLFLTILYLDDGTLSLSKSVNHKKQLIFLTANINLYLQCFPYQELRVLQQHIEDSFNIHFSLNQRPDGYGFILRTTSTKDSFKLLSLVQKETTALPSMYYKTDFDFRMALEKEKFKVSDPDYQILASHFDRNRPYSQEEISKLTALKAEGLKTRQIADQLGRTYWSISYKLNELKKNAQKTDLQ
ncbi:MAG: DNA endonuclease [Sporolactobacillus sp.]